MSGVRIEGLSTVYPNGVRAVDGLDLDIGDGEFFALLGPSGCGKTTLLRTIAGLEQAAGGSVHIGQRDVTRLEPGKRRVAMVFQDYALFPHMTVTENVAYPLRVRGVARRERESTAASTTDSLSLGGLGERRPAQLSGGQQQRVALARAVAAGGELLLLDEPLSNLDARLRLEARTFLKRLQRDLGVTTIFVTHDQAEALALADRIAVMEAGRIRQLGTPREVFRRPASVFVANFIGSTPMNLLDARVSGGAVELAGARLPVSGGVPDGPVVVGVRPEYLRLRPAGGGGGSSDGDGGSDGAAGGGSSDGGVGGGSSDGGGGGSGGGSSDGDGAVRGTVAIVENLGVSSLVTLECADGVTLGVTVPEGAEPDIAASVYAVPEPGRLLVYSAESGELLDAAAVRS